MPYPPDGGHYSQMSGLVGSISGISVQFYAIVGLVSKWFDWLVECDLMN